MIGDFLGDVFARSGGKFGAGLDEFVTGAGSKAIPVLPGTVNFRDQLAGDWPPVKSDQRDSGGNTMVAFPAGVWQAHADWNLSFGVGDDDGFHMRVLMTNAV